jgi:hypothetical protein
MGQFSNIVSSNLRRMHMSNGHIFLLQYGAPNPVQFQDAECSKTILLQLSLACSHKGSYSQSYGTGRQFSSAAIVFLWFIPLAFHELIFLTEA